MYTNFYFVTKSKNGRADCLSRWFWGREKLFNDFPKLFGICTSMFCFKVMLIFISVQTTPLSTSYSRILVQILKLLSLNVEFLFTKVQLLRLTSWHFNKLMLGNLPNSRSKVTYKIHEILSTKIKKTSFF